MIVSRALLTWLRSSSGSGVLVQPGDDRVEEVFHLLLAVAVLLRVGGLHEIQSLGLIYK